VNTTYSHQPREIYMLGTSTDGAKTYSEHRVWNADLFITTRQVEARNANADAKARNKPAKASAEQITLAQYRARA
jgi:hypothetical protein